ncbi:CheA signal transduction histidine kinase [Thermincola ferriacetica]|uniref:Chemotaxis protein CheA n=1 Tax=Thermincola ferriacetica TaxID=281456 RepID=A0A0L6W648_9FIRM|nr:chemotaxis protein CheA [Thermincola ferriacetica]KNZ70863.1 CheA signal transduction histidine kinase [Thermincola ferriacetica]
MDMSQYLDMFLEEAKEHLQKLNDSLLALESNPEGRGILDEIFRSAHTLKGMSATMGYTQVAELTHEMENVLHKLRSGDLQLNSHIVDLLFKSVDILDNAVNDIANGGEGKLTLGEIISSLRDVISGQGFAGQDPASPVSNGNNVKSGSKEEAFNEYEKNLLLEAFEQGFKCYHITVHISPKCVMKSARAFMVFKNLEEIGEIIKCVPTVQDIEEEKFDTSFNVVVISSEGPERVQKALLSIAEVEEPEIKEITKDSLNHVTIPAPAAVPALEAPAIPAGQEIATAQMASIQVPETNQTLPIVSSQPNLTQPKPGLVQKMRTSQSVRVDIHRLDSLINLVGELVINKTRLVQIGRNAQVPELTETLEQMDRISIDLQNVVMKVRMVPIDLVFSRFPRMVRDLARDLNKEIELVIEGKETEMDRTVIDEIGDPLVHLLRNAVDHGIETKEERIAADKPPVGRVILAARHEGNHVIIEVKDDGKGIDVEAVKKKILEKQLATPEELTAMDDNAILMYIFQPGFSTAKKVTDVSGRGVGLDVVKNKIEALSGNIQIESKMGEGTRFKIQLPLTLAIIQALLVRLEAEIYAIPLSFIAETTSIMPGQINSVNDQEVMLLRGDVLPLIKLHKVFNVPPSDIEKEEEINVVIVRKGEKRAGLIVDALMGQQEIVIKSLGSLLGGIPMIAGATILGNGQVSLIIDVASLF